MADRLIIGVSGASGAPIAVGLLRKLHDNHSEIETHLVITRGGALTLMHETGMDTEALSAMVSHFHPADRIGDSIASGSFKTMGMVIVPCSMKSVAGIASGYADNLLLRAASVCLKERRKLVLVARESPLSTIDLRNMYRASQAGAVILPPVLTYYSHPISIDDCTDIIVQRILSQFDLDNDSYQWEGTDEMH